MRTGKVTTEERSSTTVLVVDDEEGIREFCVGALEDMGYRVHSAPSGRQALAVLDAGQVDIVLTDLRMPDTDGIGLIREIRQRELDADVIVMTAHATISTAVEATKLGAYDYIAKPFAIDDLIALVESLVERRELMVDNRLLRETIEKQDGFAGMMGNSAPMQRIYRFLLKVASKRCPVLITGESGTGKELVARAIHAQGPWRERPFVPVDCGALTPSLIESELFGHVRGAYTGATQDRPGLLRTAADGAIFLDEIGELPLELQAKLLRVLQESEFRPVGSDARIPLRARVIAATNRNLEEAIGQKTFRGDLFYRLNVLSVQVPPLRDRKEDIAGLVQYFIARHGEAEGHIAGIAPEAVECLQNHEWPGNVRELENLVHRVLALADGPLIELHDLPPGMKHSNVLRSESGTGSQLQDAERRAILAALDSANGHRCNAAKLLGIGKTTLYAKLKEYGIAGSVQ
jgi:two-component system response regulator HydG